MHTELVESEDEDRLVDLESQNLRLNERQRLAVDLDEALAGLAVGDSGGGSLLAEALDGLGGGRHDGRCDFDCPGGRERSCRVAERFQSLSSAHLRSSARDASAMCDF